MSFEKSEKGSGTRHKAREAALQMLFAADLVGSAPGDLCENYWSEFGETAIDSKTREFADNLALGTLRELAAIDDRIRTRAEHWRIERMAIVDRNILRLAVYEFLFVDTPDTVVINEGLELARRFSTFEATQFINGILDAIKHDLERERTTDPDEPPAEKSQASSI